MSGITVLRALLVQRQRGQAPVLPPLDGVELYELLARSRNARQQQPARSRALGQKVSMCGTSPDSIHASRLIARSILIYSLPVF